MSKHTSKKRRLACEALEDRRLLATFAVSSLADSGPQTLRAAVAAANAQTGADVIVFDSQLSGDIQLNTFITVDSDIEIFGPGTDLLAIDGMQSTRMFHLTSQADLTLDGLTLKNGRAGGASGFSNRGGAIHSAGGAITIRNSYLSGNSAAHFGGAVHSTDGPITIESSHLSGNTSNLDGGAIDSFRGDVMVINSVLSGSYASRDGGAVSMRGEQFEYTNFQFTNTTFDNNQAARDGGALRTGYYSGGNFDHVTLTANTAGRDGGGVYLDPDSGLTSRNSILAANSAVGVGNDMAQRGVINFTHTLLSDNSDTFLAEAHPDAGGNVIGGALGGTVDARVGLAFGDRLPHRILRSGSPAIDAGDPAFASPPDFDGTGDDRVFNGRIDMGAVESQPRTFTVDALGGFGPGDFGLIDAIDSANANPGHDTILFHPSLDGLSGGLSAVATTAISDSVDILGPEHDPIDVTNGGPILPLLISDGTSDEIDVTLAGLDFIDNLHDAVGSHDGALIASEENLTIRASTISGGETTGNGGAIAHAYGRLTLENVNLMGNRADGSGGAIWASNTNAAVEIRNSQLSGNVSVSVANQISGGAIYQGSGLMVINDSALSGNTAYGDGGAIFARNATTVIATRTSIDGNEALGSGGDGGAIYSDSARIRLYESSVTDNYSRDDAAIELRAGSGIIRNTTISGNRVFDDAGALLIGNGALVDISHSTIARNTADAAGANVGAGGGLFALTNSSVTVDHSIIADNVSRVGPDDVADAQTLATSNSLIGVDQRNSIIDNGGNLLGTAGAPIDPRLGPLLTGPTGTKFHGPLPGSPAIDAGDPAFTTPPDFDQRGDPFARVFGSGIDIGAIEIQPQNFLVDTIADEMNGDFSAGDLSLREAILLSGGPEDDIITFDPALHGQTIALTMGELAVTGSVTIFGFGTNITIDAQGNSRVFEINDGDAAAASDVTLRGLTLTGGDTQFAFPLSSDEDGYGGAIRSYENLTLTDSVITQNEADIAGGGLFAGGIGSVTLHRTEIRANETTQEVPSTRGAGAALHNTGSVTISDSTIESNRMRATNPNGNGGGLSIQTNGNIVQIERSSINNNYAGGSGGGLRVDGSGYGHVVVSRSTISGNEAAGSFASGGGVLATMADNSLLQFFNSTISSNYAERYGGGIIAGFGSELHLLGSTVANNYAFQSGGGVFLDLSSNLVIDSSIIAGNEFVQGAAPDIRQTNGSAINADFSFIGDAFGSNLAPGLPDAAGNFIGHSQGSTIDPSLAPLADNGGPTLTHKPLPGSNVIDAGNPVPPGLGALDQIGNNRVANDRVDMGSVEVQPDTPNCDFVFNGLCDVQDIDALVAEIVSGANGSTFDLTGDGLVNLSDRDEWLELAGALNLSSGNAYLLGDANLDGSVDGTDFLAWNNHKFTSDALWSGGDFNSDGRTDGRDFLIWNVNKFLVADSGLESDEEDRSRIRRLSAQHITLLWG